jgi:hypothetical protein
MSTIHVAALWVALAGAQGEIQDLARCVRTAETWREISHYHSDMRSQCERELHSLTSSVSSGVLCPRVPLTEAKPSVWGGAAWVAVAVGVVLSFSLGVYVGVGGGSK